MHPRRSFDRTIELGEKSSLHPFLKSFLFVASIGAIAGSGYFIGHSLIVQRVAFGNEADSTAQLSAAAAGSEASP